MEIEIDLQAVRRVLREERAQALGELVRGGPVLALASSQNRHDQRIAGAADVDTLACNQGCSWCCHFTVDVRAVEVFAILDFLEAHCSAERRRELRSVFAANAAAIAPLDELERMQRTEPCPFLEAGRCTIYAVRPQTCRNYHATDAAGCRQSFEEPENLDIDPEFAPWVYQAGAAHVEGFAAALAAAGLDHDAYELNSALTAALADPASRARFLDGEQPFSDLAGCEVPSEFAPPESMPEGANGKQAESDEVR